jgi:hypothetical protein
MHGSWLRPDVRYQFSYQEPLAFPPVHARDTRNTAKPDSGATPRYPDARATSQFNDLKPLKSMALGFARRVSTRKKYFLAYILTHT